MYNYFASASRQGERLRNHEPSRPKNRKENQSPNSWDYQGTQGVHSRNRKIRYRLARVPSETPFRWFSSCSLTEKLELAVNHEHSFEILSFLETAFDSPEKMSPSSDAISAGKATSGTESTATAISSGHRRQASTSVLLVMMG